MPANEQRRKVKPSDSMINAILDSNRQTVTTVDKLQAGFDELLAVNKQTADTLDVIMQSMETFMHAGGMIADDGRTGGAIMFTQLVEASVDGLVGGIKDALGIYFNDETKAIRAVGESVVTNAKEIENGRMSRERARVSRNMSAMRGEPSIYEDIRQYIRRSDRMLAAATAERGVDEDGNQVKRTVADIRDNLEKIGEVNSDMRNELEQEMLSMESLLDHEAQEQQYITEVLESGFMNGEELSREQVQTLNDELAESKATTEYYQKVLDAGHDLIASVDAAGENIESAVRSTEKFDEEGLGALLGELMNGRANVLRKGGVTRGIEGAMGSLGGIADALGKSGELSELSGVVRGISGMVGRLLPYVFAVEAGVNAIGETNKKIRELNDKSIEIYGETRSLVENINLDMKLGMESMLTSFFSGIDQKEVEQMQDQLISAGLDPNSARYDEGFDFAISARRNYGVDSKRAVDLFEKFVVDGGKSIDDLTGVMSELSEVVQDSKVTMSEAVDELVSNINKLESATGSDELATDLEEQIMQMFEGNQGMIDLATSVVSNAEKSDDLRYQELRQRYVDEEGMTYEQASVHAALDWEREYGSTYKYGTDEWRLFHSAVNNQGQSLVDVLLSGGDVGETLSALASGEAGDVYGVGASYIGTGGSDAIYNLQNAGGLLGVDWSSVEGENSLEKLANVFGSMQEGVSRSVEATRAYNEAGLSTEGEGGRYDKDIVIEEPIKDAFSLGSIADWFAGNDYSGTYDVDEIAAKAAAESLYGVTGWDAVSESSIPFLHGLASMLNFNGVSYEELDGRSRDYSDEELNAVINSLSQANMLSNDLIEHMKIGGGERGSEGYEIKQALVESLLSQYSSDVGLGEGMSANWVDENWSFFTGGSDYMQNKDAYSFADWIDSDDGKMAMSKAYTSVRDEYAEAIGNYLSDINVNGTLQLVDSDGVITGIVTASSNQNSLNNSSTPMTYWEGIHGGAGGA